ncbi:MAG: dimethylarginine dimethylaminohydrolase family protein [Thermoanaerobaculia bacterium]
MTRLEPPPSVDLALARAQHAGYVKALRACGVEVTELPSDDTHSDAVFVQDRILVLAGRAIVCPSAVESRRGEDECLVAALNSGLPIHPLLPPAFLDGGDVLVAEDRVFVGLSERSNEAAVEQLASLLAPDYVVEGVKLPTDLLHLLSGCSYLGRGLLLATESVRQLPFAERFQPVPVPEGEAPAANVLALGGDVVLPAGYPVTSARIAERGLEGHEVSVSEFEKRDGGVTCLSLLF